MRKGILSLICTLTAVLLIGCPTLLLIDTQNKVVQRWLRGGRLAYEGKLTVWTVDAKANGKGALQSWLSARSVFYKQRNFGIYPEFGEPMTMEQVQSRIRAGEVPDVLLCGADVPQSVLAYAAVYEGPFLMTPVLPQQESGLLTPVMQSGTVVLINEDALYRAGLSPPAGAEGMDEAWISTVQNTLPGAFCYEDAMALMATALCSLPSAAQQALLSGEKRDINAFLDGDAALYVTSQDALWQLNRLELLGKALPAVIVYPLSGFASRVQYAVLMKNGDAKRQAAAAAFIAVLLGNKGQSALSDIYALPAVAGTACTRTDLASLWQCAEQTQYVYFGHGEEEFMSLVNKGATLDELRTCAQSLCNSP